MIKDLIALDDNSRVWIYQASDEFSYDELDQARPLIYDFIDRWTSHNQSLITYGNIFHRRFLALFVDESHSMASGCSIDSSVRFVTAIGEKFGKKMFDRQTVYLMDSNEYIKGFHLPLLKELYKEGVIDNSTLYFDNLVSSKRAFLKEWIKPIDQGWLKRFI
ncbi:MAG TPA: hypothetical protein PKC30_06445 [Saprospiraceae bacterium]|nr:hypothetical protein [Saprospiraceae bacterium]